MKCSLCLHGEKDPKYELGWGCRAALNMRCRPLGQAIHFQEDPGAARRFEAEASGGKKKRQRQPKATKAAISAQACEKHEILKRLGLSGASMADMLAATGYSRITAVRLLREFGIEWDMQIKRREEIKRANRIRKLLMKGVSQAEICEKVGCTRFTVYHVRNRMTRDAKRKGK